MVKNEVASDIGDHATNCAVLEQVHVQTYPRANATVSVERTFARTEKQQVRG